MITKVSHSHVSVSATVFLKMMEEDLQGSSQVKEETDPTEQKSEAMEVDEKKAEVKVEAKEEEEGSANGAVSQSTSPSQPRRKSRSCRGLTWSCFSLLLGVHAVDVKLKQKKNSIPSCCPSYWPFPQF